MSGSRLEERLVELSSLSQEEVLALQPRDGEERDYLQTLTYLNSLEPPPPSTEKMWAGHTRLMAGLEDSRPRPLLPRFFGRAGHALRAAPVALTAAAILATASGAAVITDVSGTGTAFKEVLSAIGIKETKPSINEPPPVVTPSPQPPQAPFKTQPGVIEDEPFFEDNAPVPGLPKTEKDTSPQAIPAEQDVQHPGQDSIDPGNGGGNGNGVGQDGTPPGQGGENPGNGVGPDGTPPGQGGENPGNGIGQDGTPPGLSGENPGNSGSNGQGQGQSGTSQAPGGENSNNGGSNGNGAGQGGTPPGQANENPGNGGNGNGH
jgi:hypothetical protein